MKLYKLSQTENNGYDTYDSCVVAALSFEDAKLIHPDSIYKTEWDGKGWHIPSTDKYESNDFWASTPDNVTAELIGITRLERGVVIASFNAG